MAVLFVWGLLAALAACAQAVNISLIEAAGFKLTLKDNPHGGYNIVLRRKEVSEVLAVIGRHAGAAKDVVQDGSGDVVLQFANDTSARLAAEEVTGGSHGLVLTLTWAAPRTAALEDCVNLGSNNWYGGPQQKRQYWPIERLVLPEYSYVTKEADNCGIAEPYWLSSSGVFFYFDKKVPLFVDQNNKDKNAACFKAQIKPPYSRKRDRTDLIYAIGVFEDVRKAHEYAVEKYLGKPSGIPDERMIRNPIWSTWAKYKRNIDHDVVLKFADEINEHGFSNSQMEIDDLWEVCYGSLTVDTDRFPDMKETVKLLKDKGFRVTLWAHPFINKGCEPWYTEAKNKGYLVSSEYDSVETSWWNDNDTTTAYVDFTKPEARKWYVDRLQKLKEATGVDSFKFDAGETSWSPQIPVLQGDVRDQPGILSAEYVRAVAQFGPMVEVRSGYRTQNLPIFVRMIDKDTYWTFENGLPTVVTSLLALNMAGYGLVLPDMVGGNGYSGAPSKELFVRWLQANVFMPAVQLSYAPWDYDNETVSISKRMLSIREKHAEQLLAACRRAAAAGAPVNAPLWWAAPKDAATYDIWDQYLVGESILVAPVLERGEVERDVYLPAGRWQDAKGDTHQGPAWLRDYPAPLDYLPYFLKL